jgi:hypothetical protein
MKKYILISLLIVFTIFSCRKLEDLNVNPNNVSETHPQLLLTNIEWEAFQVQGVDPLYASRMVIKTDGEESYQVYTWNRGSFAPFNNLRSITKMIEEAKRIESTTYEALGKFFRAYYFFNLTLRFGDIPYSEALKGETESVFTPKYDTQKDVFEGILKELKEADELLTNDNSVIDGDIIYSGNTLKWRKLINSFRLQILMTLSKQESTGGLNIASTFKSIVDNLPIMESNNDNGQVQFIDELGSRYSEYNNSSYGSGRYIDSTFIKRLQDRKDPRLFIFCGQTRVGKENGLPINDFNSYEGGNPIIPYSEVNDKAIAGLLSKVNLRYTTDPTTEPSMILGYSELQLILAEASVRGWINSSSATHYNLGVKASFEFYHQYATGYSQYVDEAAVDEYLRHDLVNLDKANTDEEKIERIITQKYFTSFLQNGWRLYYDYLRTGYPSFLHISGQTPPTRWMYPNSEYQENSDNVANAITNQFGSGNDKTREIPWWLK